MKIIEMQSFADRNQTYQLDVPSFWPSLGNGVVAVLAGIGFAALATYVIGTDIILPMRVGATAACFLAGLFAVVTAANCFRHASSLFGYWAGSGPVRESTGTCRIEQCTDGIWGFRLNFPCTPDPAAKIIPIRPLEENAASHDSQSPSLPGLFFELDEAQVAELSRMFDPEQSVDVRWMDLPEAVGGPLLLGVENAQVAVAEETDSEYLVA